MARLFDIERNKVIPDADIIAIPAFKKIWDRDKSKEKNTALKEISYIVFLCDFHSPYKDMRDGEKSDKIIEEVFEKVWEPDEVIKSAIKVYNKLQETPSMRLLASARKTLDKLADYFEMVDFKEVDSFTGKLLHSPTDLTRNLKEVGNIVKSLVNLEQQVKLELKEHSVQGSSEIGPFENPNV
jgi:hypothetical protein